MLWGGRGGKGESSQASGRDRLRVQPLVVASGIHAACMDTIFQLVGVAVIVAQLRNSGWVAEMQGELRANQGLGRGPFGRRQPAVQAQGLGERRIPHPRQNFQTGGCGSGHDAAAVSVRWGTSARQGPGYAMIGGCVGSARELGLLPRSEQYVTAGTLKLDVHNVQHEDLWRTMQRTQDVDG